MGSIPITVVRPSLVDGALARIRREAVPHSLRRRDSKFPIIVIYGGAVIAVVSWR